MNYTKVSILIFFTCFLLGNVLYAQDAWSGRIFENKTRILLQGIKVENLNSHFATISNANGNFSIKAAIGDRIRFSGLEYQPDTVYISKLKYAEVFLDLKQNMLKEVKVLTPEIKTGSLKAPVETGPFNSKSVLYQTDAAGNYIGGIKIRLFDWDKDEKKKSRDIQLAADEETEAQIAKVFSPQNVQNYLPLKGQELANFIILYIPDVKTYKEKNFNLLLYLSASYKEFIKIPAEQRQSATYFQLTK